MSAAASVPLSVLLAAVAALQAIKEADENMGSWSTEEVQVLVDYFATATGGTQ